MDYKTVLSLKNITKRYPGVLALNQVSIDLLDGEVHALLGENGAGKSTLIKAIAGAITFDEGLITINGKEYQKMTPHLSRSLGIEVIYQEFNLVPTLSVAENIFLGAQPDGKILVDLKGMKELNQGILQTIQHSYRSGYFCPRIITRSTTSRRNNQSGIEERKNPDYG